MTGLGRGARRASTSTRAREVFEASTDFTSGSRRSSRSSTRTASSSCTASRSCTRRCHDGRAPRRVGRRRADRHRDRDPLGPRRDLRRGGRAAARAPRAGCSRSPTRLGHRRSPRPARTRGRTTSTSGSSTREHYNRLREELRWVAQRNNTWSLHVHVGVRGADRAIAVCDHLRARAAAAAGAVGELAVPRRPATPACTRCAREIFTRTFPRCGVHEPFGDWAAYADFIDLLDRDRLDRRVDPAVVERAPAPRLRHGRAADLRRADARRRSRSALAGADHRLHRPGGARLRRRAACRRRCASARSRRTSGGRSATASTAPMIDFDGAPR